MLEVYAYKAGKGDCIRIRFSENHNIFVDSGVLSFASSFKNICSQIIKDGESLDALILTHVDDDHIGGILANLRQHRYKCPFNEVWMNHNGIGNDDGTYLSTKQNNEVAGLLKKRHIPVYPMLINNIFRIEGAVIEALWPEKKAIACNRIINKIDKPLSRHNDYRYTLSYLANKTIPSQDTSQNNKSSIIFTFSYEGRRLLFTGDAWAKDVERASGHYDLVKLPHHGSVRNISESFPEHFSSNNFLICTDGIDHPDKQTIATLEKWYGEINVYSPSNWWTNGFFIGDDKKHNINYYKKEGLVVKW